MKTRKMKMHEFRKYCQISNIDFIGFPKFVTVGYLGITGFYESFERAEQNLPIGSNGVFSSIEMIDWYN